MAKKSGGRVFNVSVIGLSGTEREKGLAGVGKSCLCNRFMHPLADDYHTDHISVLSQSDFGGRVINNDHFLYWGETTKTDEGSDYTFHVIEQTEFVDDVSFQPFRTGRIEPYTKRCANTKVQSAEKLMYICKEQLGIETDSTYEQKLMPEGRINVDGFLCVFDVSAVQQRTLEKQVEFITSMVNNVIKTKKPLVMVTTKNDSADDRYSKEAEKLCNRKEFRVNLPLVETSAHTNVNVELAFMTLAHLIDKTKARTKIVPFSEADRARKEILNVAEEAYRNLLRSHVTDAKAVWVTWRKKFESKPDYTHYVELFGSEKARKLFRQHCKALRDEQVKKRETHFLTRLPDVLQQFLPSLDIISDRSWLACQRYIRQHPDFDQAFVEVCADENDSWKFSDFVDDYEDTRLPFDLLTSTDAETYFRNHLNALQAEHKKLELKNQFRDLLAESGHVTPGKPLSEAYVFFVGKECFNSLLEHERLQVYEAYQADLRAQARHDFQELLWEKTELFTRLNPSTRLTPSDLKDITTALEEDHRYKVLHRMEEARKVMILNHLGFIQCPSKQMCYFKDNCVDVQVSKVLAAKAIRPDILDNRLDSSDSGEKPMNLVLLGKETLATQVNKEIRHLCPDDEYRLSNSSLLFSLDYRPIDGDVTLTENSFATVDFKPHGCFCVYNSAETFEYVRASLEQTLLADLKRDQGQELQGMPIIIIQAYNHRLSKDVQCKLQDDGKQLAKKLHSEFIDIPADEKLVDGKSFYLEQIEQALHSVISHACNIPRDCIDTDSEADMRIAVCMICGDPYSLDIPLGPILGHDLCSVSSESPGIVTFETFLDFCKRKVEVTFMSYHEASMRKSQMYHGYILVYSVHRKASLATMKAFAESFYDIPVLILAVTESEGASAMFSDDQIQNLIFEGNGLADHLQGNFMTTTRTFSRQSGAYTLFFRDCWERREETESQYPNLYQEEESSPPSYYRLSIGRRPPLPPPISPMPHPQHPDLYPTAKSSTSNSQSTEDSDPQYVRPVRYIQDHSDSEHERASSASPPPNSAQSTNHYAVSPLYHPHTYQNGERLVRPSQLKHSRDVYAVWALNDPPDRHVKAASFALGTKLTSSSEEGECMTTSLYDTARVQNDEEWVDNSLYDHGDVQASGYPAKTKRLDLSKFGQVSEFLSHNLRRARHSSGSRVQAPLALPEQLEIGDYATVRDAVPENDYASVQDALPVGRFHKIRSSRKKHNKPKGLTDSDSELSSLERSDSKDLYSKVNRKPTPHKKKWKSREHHSEERLAGTSTTDRVQSNSPSDGSDGSADEGRTNRKEKKKRPSVRKRWKSSTAEKKSIPPPSTSPPMSDSDYVGSPPGRGIDDENLYEPINPRENTSNTLKFSTEDVDLEPGDGTKTKNRVRALKDPDKAKKKEEKRLREEERKRNKELKEEGKRRNREDMKRLKFKRKDGKMIGASQCSNMLEDHPPSADNPQIPLFVEKCVQYIEEEGMQAEGIYRVPGNKAQVDLLISKFHEDSAVDISTLDIQVNAVATALKGFFSELTEPLVPTHLYEQLFEAARIPQKSCKLVALRGVLKKIPSPNYEVLRFLTIHLNRVSKNSASNSMDCRNLGVCWWPTLLRLDIATLDKITEVSSICVEVVHLLVEQAGFFFYDADEV